MNFESVSRSPIEERYALEELLMNAVSVGDTKNALEYQRRFRKHHLVPRTDDLVRNSQNMMIILNTLLRKAAQAGGVHPLHIDRLSTQIAIQIESMNTLHDLNAFGLTIVRRYCLLVQNYSRQNVSPLVRTCLNHIDFHYAEDLSLSQMAAMCSVSSTHLSAQFRKDDLNRLYQPHPDPPGPDTIKHYGSSHPGDCFPVRLFRRQLFCPDI